jgi:SAM-dependent methyltransferase
MFYRAQLYSKVFRHYLREFHNFKKQYSPISSLQQFVDQYVDPPSAASLGLDLGCGLVPKNIFRASRIYGVDMRPDHDETIRHANLAVEPIPFPDGMFDFCSAIDFIEHIPRIIYVDGASRYCFIELMSEIHRVLKPGGYFVHLTPAYPAKQAFQDPTHVNIITEDTFPYYFCGRESALATELGYGFHGRFEFIAQGWLDNQKLASLLRAI